MPLHGLSFIYGALNLKLLECAKEVPFFNGGFRKRGKIYLKKGGNNYE
ncbi:hypothetical protein GMMP15_580047 [Candidatus Magnetomoraceae bacterium gMMP-15]